jgi:hypothetical protein
MLSLFAPLLIMGGLIGPLVGLPLWLKSRGWGQS